MQRLASDGAEEARVELAALFDDLVERRERGALPREGKWALAWAGFALAHDDAELWPEAERALDDLTAHGYDGAAWSLSVLGEVAFQAGRLDLADAAARHGVEAPGFEAAWRSAPRLHYLRAEIARQLGRWDDVESSLRRLYDSLRPDEQLVGAYASHLPVNREFRARFHALRGRLRLELGLLDYAAAEQELAEEAARLSGVPEALAMSRHLAIDVALSSQRYRQAVELARSVLEEPLFIALSREQVVLFQLAEGICQAAVERRALLGVPGAGEPVPLAESPARRLLLLLLDSGLVGRPDALKALRVLADGALLRGEHALAAEHLEDFEELVALAAGDDALREETIAAALRWQLVHRDPASDAPALADAHRGLERAFGELLLQWGSIPEREGGGGVGFLRREWRSEILATLIDAERTAAPGPAGDRRAFEHVLRAQAMGSRARREGISAPKIGEVQEALLAPRRALLVLLPARSRSHLFVLEGERLECVPLPPYESLRAAAEPVTGGLRARGRGVTDDALEALGTALLPSEVAQRMSGWDEVYALGFDRLRGLLVASLPRPDGAMFGVHTGLSTLSSIPLAVARVQRLRSPAAAGALDALFVLAPGSHGLRGLDDLSLGEAEERALTAPFASRHAVLRGDDVQEQLLARRDELGSLPLLFVLAHTVPDHENEWGAKLVLGRGEDGEARYLGVDEIRELSLSGVVLLASCSAAKAPPRIGDDALAHLGGAFLDAGAQCVILARDLVEYRATLALFERLHVRLADGATTAEALRAALAETLGDDPWDGLRRTGYELLGLGFERPLGR